jgi:aflatoxin B1 aldehyde reductase
MASLAEPRIILGLMTYGPPSAPDVRVDDLGEFRRHLDTFQSLGYNEIDTARIYVNGKQESFTAKAGLKDRGLSVATKSYPLSPGAHKAENIRKDLETSLKELGADTVDIFYLHHPDRSTPFGETLAEVDKMYKEGKFKMLGLSNFAALEIAEIVMLCLYNGWVRPKIYQGVYNVISKPLRNYFLSETIY